MTWTLHRIARRTLVGLVAVATLAVPAQASAAGAGVASGTLVVVSDSETSNITVTQVGDSFVVADPGRNLETAGSCSNSGSPAQVICPAAGITSVMAFFGDGNDRFNSSAIALRTVVKGGDGDDEIITGAGADTIEGNSGNDRIVARDGTVDEIACGSGSDSGQVDADDKLADDCESAVERPATSGGTDPPATAVPPATDGPPGDGDKPPVAITTPSAITLSPRYDITIGVSCNAVSGSCRGTIELIMVNGKLKARSVVGARRRKVTKKGTVLGRRNFAVRSGRKKNVRLRLERRGRQRIIRKHKKRKIRAKLVVTVQAPDGTKTTTEKNVTISPPKARRTSGRGRTGNRKNAQ